MGIGHTTMKVAAVAAVWMLITATTGCAAIAHADGAQFFQSPSGNISCLLYLFPVNTGSADCQIRDSTWAAPPRPSNCQGGWGDSLGIVQGEPAKLECRTDRLLGENSPALAYGSAQTVAEITCDSELSGMTCRDSSTGHFFFLSRDSYQLG
jgi:hypothetical protein